MKTLYSSLKMAFSVQFRHSSLIIHHCLAIYSRSYAVAAWSPIIEARSYAIEAWSYVIKAWSCIIAAWSYTVEAWSPIIAAWSSTIAAWFEGRWPSCPSLFHSSLLQFPAIYGNIQAYENGTCNLIIQDVCDAKRSGLPPSLVYGERCLPCSR